MYNKELLKYIGSIEQIGGLKSYTLNHGKAEGVRVAEIDTGVIRFVVVLDRCMDIAQAFYKGQAISWISKTGITAPQYYEKDGLGWLRGFYGGLLTTCGLKNIGRPYAGHGLHGRIANTPAGNISLFADWIEGEYVMKVSGEMREGVVFGENLVLKRTITAKMFESKFTVEDKIINEGFDDENIALCYHCNFGYPLVQKGAKIINVPEEYSHISSPVHGTKEECIDVFFKEEDVTVGIENDSFGCYITYNRKNLPDFVIWKMLGEGDYVVGLEPRTTCLQGEQIEMQAAFVTLKPFEPYCTKLVFEAKSK